MRLALSLLSLVALGLASCANAKNDADAWTEEPQRETRPFRETEILGQGKEMKNDLPMSAWVGVRHDLALAQGPKTEKCSCLAAEVGSAGDAKFEWQGESPVLGENALVIAISAQGVPCAGGPVENNRRASISAVDRENEDILVEVEELPEGRPLALGAIIPKPGPKGSVYVRPKNHKVVYARGTGIGARCRVQ